MTQSAFFEPRRASPTSIAIVVAIHAAVISAAMLARMDVIPIIKPPPTTIEFIPLPIDPPPKPVDPATAVKPTRPFAQDPIIDTEPTVVDPIETTHGPIVLPPVGGGVIVDPVQPPDPVRIDAELDPRFIDRLKPPYPLAEQREGREGSVTLRVLIGADGRVKAADKVKATTDGFFRAAQRQALSQWRFKPATLDGKPIESRKLMTLRFELNV
jgi:protein TonB